jgi:hypothetical protein
MKTKVTLSASGRQSEFVVSGNPSAVSDRIVKIKRALKLRITHGAQGMP